jgi:hypothetical protein
MSSTTSNVSPRQDTYQEYDLEAAAALAKRYGFEVVGPQLA